MYELPESETSTNIGILLTNLGTPDAPTPSALRTYLKAFLWDPRVVEEPRLKWWLILHGIILNIRPGKSAKSYQKVWYEDGSPLLSIGKKQQHALQQQLRQNVGDHLHVELAMRYGNPSIQHGMEALRQKGCRKVIVLPLYPQYSASTTASTFDAVADLLKTWRRIPELQMVDAYYDHPAYIEALSASVKRHWQQHGKAERLLISFHGIPERFYQQGDPYPTHCMATATRLRQALKLTDSEAPLTFQSRFGREPWLQPYTDATLKQLGRDGIASVDVICPGFAADCLETIEEVGMENRDYFLEAGGRQYRYIPALNDDKAHIDALCQIIQQRL